MAEGARIVETKPLESFRTMAMKCVRCRMCGMTNPDIQIMPNGLQKRG